MSYKGRYNPRNPQKYKGNPHNVIYRSLWERKFMVYCDNNTSVLEWGSEEVIIPYLSPLDGRIHRYFPDFYIKIKQHSGTTKKLIIEVKPKKQTKPPKEPQRKTKRYLNETCIFRFLLLSLRPCESSVAFASFSGQYSNDLCGCVNIGSILVFRFTHCTRWNGGITC